MQGSAARAKQCSLAACSQTCLEAAAGADSSAAGAPAAAGLSTHCRALDKRHGAVLQAEDLALIVIGGPIQRVLRSYCEESEIRPGQPLTWRHSVVKRPPSIASRSPTCSQTDNILLGSRGQGCPTQLYSISPVSSRQGVPPRRCRSRRLAGDGWRPLTQA